MKKTSEKKFLESLSAEEIAESLEKMYADDATDVIQDLPENIQEEVLEAIKDDEHSSEISMLLNFDEELQWYYGCGFYICKLELDSS